MLQELVLQTGAEHSTLCRLNFQVVRTDAVLKTPGQAATDGGDGAEAENVLRARKACEGLSNSSVFGDCVAWPMPSKSLAVACLHKAGLARMFKAAYSQQAALGLRVGKDIKAVADLKPLADAQLHHIVTAGIARTLEVPFVKVAVEAPTGASQSTVRLHILAAGLGQFSTFSVAKALNLGHQDSVQGPACREVLLLLRQHVFCSREAWRRAERLLYNTRCVVLPSLTSVYIKGLTIRPPTAPAPAPAPAQEAAATRPPFLDPATMEVILERWRRTAPHLTIPEPLPLEGLMLHVSQDPDSDTGDCGVYEVPACCCWACPGLTPVQHTAPQQNYAAHDTTVEQFVRDLETSSYKLWAGQPFKCISRNGTSHTQLQTHAPRQLTSAQQATAQAPATAPASQHAGFTSAASLLGATTASQAAGIEEPAAGSVAAGLGWTTAGATQATQATLGVPQEQPLSTSGARSWEAGPTLPLCASASLWYPRHNTGGDGGHGSLDEPWTAQQSTLDTLDTSWQQDPRVTAILTNRATARETEKNRWSQLTSALQIRRMQDGEATETTGCPASFSQPRPASQLAGRTSKPIGPTGPSSGAPRPPSLGPPRAPSLAGRKTPQLATATAAAKKATAAATGKTGPAAGAKAAAKPKAAADGAATKPPAAKKQKTAVGALPVVVTPVTEQVATAATEGLLQLTPGTPATAAAVTAAATAAAAAPGASKAVASLRPDIQPSQSQPQPSTAAAATTAAAAAPARKRTKAADLDMAVVEAKVSDKAAAGQWSGLTIPELQAWLRARKLTVGGKKAELEARVAAVMGLTHGANNPTAV